MQRRVDDGKLGRGILGRCGGQLAHRVDEALERVVFDNPDKPSFDGFVVRERFDIGEGVDSGNRLGYVMRRLGGYLAPVGTVGFVAVVGRGVMARRHADAARAAQVAHGERKRRRRFDAWVEVRDDPVRGQHFGRMANELFALVTAVARNRYRRALEVRIQA